MHNQAIERDWIMCYNLPPGRWKIRRAKTGQEKDLLRLDRERRKIQKTIWGLGYEDLIPPVQRGWKRFFILREDVTQDKRSEIYQRILDKINTIQHSYRKDFKVKKRRFGKRCYVVREQKLQEPTEFYFTRMKFSEEEQGFFYKEEEYNFYYKRMVPKYVFSEPWRFVLKVQPNIITKTRRRDWDLERRYREINDYFDRNELSGKLRNLQGYSTKYWRVGCKKKYDNPLKNKSIHLIEDEYYNEL